MKTARVEHDVLLCVARRDLDEPRKAELGALLKKPIDWDYLIAAAHQHGLIPLLHRHLSSNREDVPHDEFEKIRQASVRNSQAVLHLIGRLNKLLEVFKDEDLPVLVFKGPVLSEIAYGEKALRRAGDLDILVQRGDFGRAKTLLESLGYQMTPQLTHSQQAAHLAFQSEIEFMRDEWFTIVDLHWSLMPKSFSFELHARDVMARAQQLSIGGKTVNTFGLEDLILYLSIHGAKHYWSRLEWISALAEIIRSHSQIVWPELIDRARNAGAIRRLALGMHLAQHVGDVDVPPSVFNQIDAARTMQTIAAEILSDLFRPQRKEYRSVKAFRGNLKIMDRKRDVIASVLRPVFVPTTSDWETLALPGSLHRLYYVLRPFRLAGRYSVAAWQSLTAQSRISDEPGLEDPLR